MDHRVDRSGNDSKPRRLQQKYPLPVDLRYSEKSISKPYKHRNEDEYFESANADDKDNEGTSNELEYQPAPGSPSAAIDEEVEEDPLDAYMSSIEVEAKRDLKNIGQKLPSKRDDIEEADDQETFFQWLEENPNAGVSFENDSSEEDGELVEYDNDGNIIVYESKKWIDPLPPLDHSLIPYIDFAKSFYVQHDHIAALNEEQVADLREKLGISVAGYDIPHPVSSFAHFGFDDQLMSAIRKADFSQPTPIQAQAIPIILSGRDLIGIAETGSGKTCTYVWPALVHIMDQPDLKEGDGPIALICVPTRELAQQIHLECRRYGRAYNIESGCVFGGSNLHEQVISLQQHPKEILVCTPGRLIDLVKKEAVNLSRVTYLVFDEADRMFDFGFGAQVRSIAEHVRPDRQCLLFSATFKPKIESLARDILNGEVVRVIQGCLGEANRNCEQIVEVFNEPAEKWTWLMANLTSFTSSGKVLIFVTRKENCVKLHGSLKEQRPHTRVGLLHGDFSQADRFECLKLFKSNDENNSYEVLVASDVASRGLDIRKVKTVINYDVARNVETHIHRIGRTARAGEKGKAYTLTQNQIRTAFFKVCSSKDKEFAPHLVRNLEQSGQIVPELLTKLALQNDWFVRSRHSKSVPRKKIGGFGLGYKDKTCQNTVGPMAHYRGISAKGTHLNQPREQRLSALKNSFQSQFKSSFVKASLDSGLKSATSVAVPNNATKKRKDKKWDDEDLSESKSKEKKSRWAD